MQIKLKVFVILTLFSHSLWAQVSSEGAAKIIVEELKDAPRTPVFIIQGNEERIDGEKILEEIKRAGVNNAVIKDQPPKLTYFLEVRNNRRLNFSKNALPYDPVLGSLKTGQLLMVEDTVAGYIDKLRLERKNLGIYKPIKIYPPEDPGVEKPLDQRLYVYDDYLSAYTVNPFEQPLTMMPVNSLEFPIVTVYSKPGKFHPRQCDNEKGLCVGWLDSYASIYLLETRLVFNEKYPPSADRMDLYYYIGFEYKLPTGELRRGTGWVESKALQRKIEHVPQQLAATRLPAMADFELPNEDKRGMFVFGENRPNTDKLNRFTKNMTERKARELASIWSVNLAWDAAVDTSAVNIKHSWLPEPISIAGATVSTYASLPIFLDLIIKGNLKMTLPITSNQSDKKPVLFKAEEWLQLATPFMIEDAPLQIGVGAYYFTMLNTNSTYGVNSLLGVQGQIVYDNDDMWTYFRYAPVGNDLKFSLSNRDLNFGYGVKMRDGKWFKDWGIYGDYSDIHFKSINENVTDIQQFNLGVMVYF